MPSCHKEFRRDQVISRPEMSYPLSTAWYYQIQPFSRKLARILSQLYRSSCVQQFLILMAWLSRNLSIISIDVSNEKNRIIENRELFP